MNRLNRPFVTICILTTCALASAQQPVIPIWTGVAPGSETWTQKEVEYLNGKQRMIRNVVTPTLTVFLPDKTKATGTAVVVCPGGGFRFHSWDSEGIEVAKWLQERGVAAFVLKYRLVNTGATPEEFQKHLDLLFGRKPAKPDSGDAALIERAQAELKAIPGLASADGRQAIKVVREHAAEFGVKADRVGIIGFSAGAAVTMGVVMDHKAESRPDFAAPIYGGGTGGAPVPTDAMPMFILVASDDGASAGSLKLYSEWKGANKPVELHIYAKGGHGFGMIKRGLPVDTWIERFGDWLGSLGLLKP
ncbi:MAG: alpha/beta hydrolase [Chthonomonadales bacterium]